MTQPCYIFILLWFVPDKMYLILQVEKKAISFPLMY